MPCATPIEGYRQVGGGFTQNKIKSTGIPITIPCGRCIGCRLDYSRDWAVRIMHEARFHEDNCFITLTYAPEHLPEHGTLVKKHFQDFIKRLRKKYSHKQISYFHCGEYGDKRGRPHYHAILFGIDFTKLHTDPDTHPSTRRASGSTSYTSPALTKLWGKGITDVGNTTFKSAAYVARYITKKVHGQNAKSHYEIVTDFDEDTGEISLDQLQPEYVTMSLKIPHSDGKSYGIGAKFYHQYKEDIFQQNQGQIIIRHDDHSEPFKCRVPRYYLKLMEKEDPDRYRKIKDKNLEYLKQRHHNERVNGKPSEESILANLHARSSKLIRSYEQSEQEN